MLVFWEGAPNQYQNPSYSHPRNKGLVRLIKGQANGCFKLYIHIYIYIKTICNMYIYMYKSLFFCGGLSEGSSDGVFLCCLVADVGDVRCTERTINTPP